MKMSKESSREPTLAELEAALRIDEYHLERECQIQAEMFYRVAQKGTLAISKRDAAKQALAEVEAELDSEIRRDAEVAGDKITEPAIKNKIKLERRYQRASAELQKLSTEVGDLAALRESYDHRKEMLKLMVKLYLANYFGEIEERGAVGQMREASAHAAKEAAHVLRQQRNSREVRRNE